MAYRPGDHIYNIIWKLVEQAGGIPRPGDTERNLLAKYLTAIGGTPMPMDSFYNLLARVVRQKGGTPLPGDTEWGLLVKWLQAEGECRACGDSPHDLWRKILELGESEPEPEGDPELRVQQGVTVITDGQPGVIDFGTVCQTDTSPTKIFTVFNDGDGDLTTSGLTVPAGYTIVSGLSATIPPGGSDTFSVRLNSSNTEGTYAGNISFSNNDSDENPFNFPVTGLVTNSLGFDSAQADSESPWNGSVSWFFPLECFVSDPAWFGIEVNEDGGGFADLQFEVGSERTHLRASDGSPHTWVFRVAGFDAGFNRVTDWVESNEISGPV